MSVIWPKINRAKNRSQPTRCVSCIGKVTSTSSLFHLIPVQKFAVLRSEDIL